MRLDPFVIYLSGAPRALTFGQSEKHAVEAFRMATLGQGIAPDAVTVESAWTAPADDVLRVCLLGLYARMLSVDLAAQAQGRARRNTPPARSG